MHFLKTVIRSEGIDCQQEADDLEAIAEGWGVPVATAAWAIIVEQLARWRRQAPELGPHGLTIAAAVTVLRQRATEAASGAAGDKRPGDD